MYFVFLLQWGLYNLVFNALSFQLLLFKSIKVCVYVIFRFDAYIVIASIHYNIYYISGTTLSVQYPQGLVLFGTPCAPKCKPFTQPTWQVQCLYRPAQHLVIATLSSCKTMTSTVKEVYLTRESILYWIYEYSEPIGFMLIWIWNLYPLFFQKPMNRVTIYFWRKINRK